jgi:hypothetical protein
VRNLLAVYGRAIPADIEAGARWYPDARRIVREWSEHYGVSVETVACVTAAISPQCEWPRNLVIADDVLAERAVSIGGALHANIAKARRILADRATSTIAYFPHGPKVASFSLNLAGNDTAVTVDGHAIQVALDDVQSTVTLKWAPYLIFAECYERAAGKVHRPPAEFQAIVWHVWKRLHPRVSKIAARKQWEPIGEY